jgi:hypothetical protein
MLTTCTLFFLIEVYSITQDMANLSPFRLKSRKPLWKEEFLMQPFSKSDYWKAAWQEVDIFNKSLIEDPTKQNIIIIIIINFERGGDQ